MSSNINVQELHDKLEEMYKLREATGKDPACDFKVRPGYRSTNPSLAGETKMVKPGEMDEWYSLNEGASTPGESLFDAKDATIEAEEELATRLADLEKQINTLAASLGVNIVYDNPNEKFAGKMTIDIPSQANIDSETRDEIYNLIGSVKGNPAPAVPVSKSRTEHEVDDGEIPFGAGDTAIDDDNDDVNSSDGESSDKKEESPSGKSMRDLAAEVSRRPALQQQINDAKEDLMERDVKAKKVLEARRQLEIVKDIMDMEAAVYVAKKMVLELQLKELQLNLLRAIADGESPDTIDHIRMAAMLKHDEIRTLETEFNNASQGHQVSLNGAIMNLQTASKDIEVGRKNNMKSGIKETLRYDDDGIMSGLGIELTKDGHTTTEEELYDKDGIMINNVAEVLNRKVDININGTVVEILNKASSDNVVETSFSIGGEEKLRMETGDGQVDIAEQTKYNQELIQNGHVDEAPASLDRVDNTSMENTMWRVAGRMVLANELSQVLGAAGAGELRSRLKLFEVINGDGTKGIDFSMSLAETEAFRELCEELFGEKEEVEQPFERKFYNDENN